MATVRAGIVTEAGVNGPINGAGKAPLVDKNSGGTWAAVWFVAAIIILFFVL